MVRHLPRSISRRLRMLRIRGDFDRQFYLAANPDVAAAKVDPFEHFMKQGWREMRDPSPHFSVAFYLEQNADVRESGINPLVHYVTRGRREGRQPRPPDFSPGGTFRPLISVIVPNYNHARFLGERLDSILGQTYRDLEVIVLDDASTDGSLDIVHSFRQRDGRIVSIDANRENSGSVFRQWRRGIEAAKGDLIWICESDDSCERNFLEHLVPHFADRSVMLAFGRVQFANEAGEPKPGLDGYREAAEPGIWHSACVRTARDWFTSAFAAANVIPNVGGCVFRRGAVAPEAWDEAADFKVLGDWLLYIRIAGGGRIAFEPRAVSYFRQHGRNTSVRHFTHPSFYAEHGRIMEVLRAVWGAPEEPLRRMFAGLARHRNHVGADSEIDLDRIIDLERIVRTPRRSTHILIGILGFELGGGELFPILLANELVHRGYLVSLCVLQTNAEDARIRARLDARVPVYEASLVRTLGVQNFLDAAGIDVVHTHFVGIDALFAGQGRIRIPGPYVATLHGSYEACGVADVSLLNILRNVDRWVYLTPRNLAHLEGIPLDPDAVRHIPNGVPQRNAISSLSRDMLGIAEGDLVFALVSRAIRPKGWREAVAALKIVQGRTSRKVHLLLCGDGEEHRRLQKRPAARGVHLLGFREDVEAVYRISDCAILPSRFGGESFPLTLIEAMQAGKPVIATDIGQIRSMIADPQGMAGTIIAPEGSDRRFAAALADAMHEMTNDAFRRKCAREAARLARRYDFGTTVDAYIDLYREGMERGIEDKEGGQVRLANL